MKRFVQSALVLFGLVATLAHGQALYREGTHYFTIAKPVRTADPNKIEVTEAFWYGCPHCYALDPKLEGWVAKLPSDVAFVRSPITWNPMTKVHAQIYYTELALGTLGKTHKVIFDAIVQGRSRLDTQDEIRKVFVAQGISPADFDKAWTSFGVNSQVKQADARMMEYGISGVPNLIVNGKYRIEGVSAPGKSEAQMHEEMLKIADFLITQERAAGKK